MMAVRLLVRYGLIVASGAALFLNLLIILIILIHRKMRTVTNIYVLNLALFDILNSVVLFYHHSSRDYHSIIFCKLYITAYATAFYGEAYQVALLAVDRCASVCFPLWARGYRSNKLAILGSLGVWVLSFVLSLPFIYHARMDEKYVCYYYWNRTAEDLISCIFAFIIPLIITSIAYFMIVSKLKKMRFQEKHFHKIRKVTIFVVIIITIHVLLWLPFWIIDFYNIAHVVDIDLLVVEHIGYLHCLINPAMYALVNSKFRKHMIKMFTVKCLFAGPEKEEETSTNTPTQELQQL